MKKTQVNVSKPRLQLRKESLKPLSAEQLAQADGGINTIFTDSKKPGPTGCGI